MYNIIPIHKDTIQNKLKDTHYSKVQTHWKYKNVNIDFKIMDDAVDAGEEGEEESERMCHKNMIYKAMMKTVNVLEPELAK